MKQDRSAPARRAVVEAFSRLVLARRSAKPPVADLLKEAGVARSTFYEHFEGRDSVLIEALEGPLSLLADAATRAADEARLVMLLEHFRENRRGAADILSGPLAARVRRRFAEKIAAQLPEGEKEAALEIANQMLAQIRIWLDGETRYPADRLAALLVAGAAALRSAFASVGKY
jgi:AcrR family transcriptional regulator